MKTVIDRQILGSTRRLGGYGSSMHGLNENMNRYDQFDFLDFLNDPNERPDFEYAGVRDHVEQAYGLQ